MSLQRCLPGLVKDGKISQEQAQEARELYDELVREYVKTGSREAAEMLASKTTIDAMQRQVTRKAFLAGKRAKSRGAMLSNINTGYRSEGGLGGRKPPSDGSTPPIDPRAGVALFDRDPRASFGNLEGRRKAITARALGKMNEILTRHSANLIGKVRDKAGLRDLVRELFGEDTGNASAKAIAGAWRESAEMLRRMFNEAGGEIGFRADWGMPQSHNSAEVRKAGFQAWRDFILPKLDLLKMVDKRTGKPFTRESIELALRDVWETIRTDGWNKRPAGSARERSLANRRADPRFLVFKSADDWMAYNAKFGSGTAFDAMMHHVRGMARDIAAMQTFGPNPEAEIDWLKGLLVKSAQMDTSPGSKAVKEAENAGKKIDDLWAEYKGETQIPRSERLAKLGSGYRAYKTSTSLGGATLSGTSDFAFQAMRRKMNGLARRSMIPQYLKLMLKPGNAKERKALQRRGFILDELAGRTTALSRMLGEETSAELPRHLSEGVMRASLLSRHTEAVRGAFVQETLATYTEHADKTFDQLPDELRDVLKRYQIDEDGWNKIRSAPREVIDGIDWIDPNKIEDEEVALRFTEMLHSEQDVAVPIADLATRAFMNRKLERGTVLGELGRSALLFKSFGISVMIRQWQELMAMPAKNAAMYFAKLMALTTLMGGVSLALKDAAGGKDPRAGANPFDDKGELNPDWGFWGQAMAQGGGFGIFGDFVRSSQNRFGGGMAETFSGPLIQDVQTIADVIGAKHPGAEAVKKGKGFIPGNNLWYLREAFDRMAADQIGEWIDPAYRKSYGRAKQYAAEQGTQYFWKPGQTLPSRAPDLSNIVEEGPGQ